MAARSGASHYSHRKVTDLDENQGTVFKGIWCVLALMRTANPASGRIFAVFVKERTFYDQHFFTAEVSMRFECGVGRPFDESNMLATVFTVMPQ